MKKRGETVNPTTIYKVFCCNRQDGNDKCYEDSIVRLCLGSFAHVDCSYVVDIEFAPCKEDRASHVVSEINLSNRGNRLAKSFVDSFTYLQLIVDDYYLPIPRCVGEHFKYDNIDYGYLVESSSVYRESLNRMLQKKIKQVYVFLEILRVSLEYEKEAFSDVFEQLNKYKIPIPNVDDIEKRVRYDLDKIMSRFDFKVYDCVKPEDIKTVRASLREELREVYLK